MAVCPGSGDFVGMGLFDSGARSFYANTPIRNLGDVKGMSLRVPPSDLWMAVIDAMSAYPKALSLDDAKLLLVSAARARRRSLTRRQNAAA